MPSSASRVAKAPEDALRTGPRVYIRHARPLDAPVYVALRTSSRRFLTPWEPRPPRGGRWNDPARILEEFARGATGRHERLLVVRRGDDELLGMVGVSEIAYGVFQNAYIGYWIGAAFARHGYMREGLALALDHVFGTLKLHRVEANIQPSNIPSRTLARSLGFRQEGYSPGYLKIAGRWADHERWALLSDDWKRGRPTLAARLREKAAAAPPESPGRPPAR